MVKCRLSHAQARPQPNERNVIIFMSFQRLTQTAVCFVLFHFYEIYYLVSYLKHRLLDSASHPLSIISDDCTYVPLSQWSPSTRNVNMDTRDRCFTVCFLLNQSFSAFLGLKSIRTIMRGYTAAQKPWKLSPFIGRAKAVCYFFKCVFVFMIEKVQKTRLGREILLAACPIKDSLSEVMMLDCYALIWNEIWGSQMRFFFLYQLEKN